MRIFCAIHSNPSGASLAGSKIWQINIVDSLRSMGADLVFPTFDMDAHRRRCRSRSGDAEEARQYYSERILQEVKKAHGDGGIDLFLSYYYSCDLLPQTLEEIGRLGVPTVNFFCDSIDRFDQVAEISGSFDFCIVPEKETLPRYRSVGANPVHIQMAANPDVYKPSKLPLDYEVTFVGQNRFNRSRYIAWLVKHGIDVRVWGTGWGQDRKSYPFLPDPAAAKLRDLKYFLERTFARSDSGFAKYQVPLKSCGPPLPDRELIEMFSRSRISLGLSELWDRERRSYRRNVKLRDFEAPMSGAFYLTGYLEELSDYYDIGSEIVCYHDEKDLLDKVNYYLRHPAEAQRIREAGYRRALAEHTWQKRFERLFGIMGLNCGPGKTNGFSEREKPAVR